MKMKSVFETGETLALMFTPKCKTNCKYLANGMKPIEVFVNDILKNLVVWAVKGTCIYYRTKDYIYEFNLITMNGGKTNLVEMMQLKLGTYERLDDWANLSSVKFLGAEFLNKNKEKKGYVVAPV